MNDGDNCDSLAVVWAPVPGYEGIYEVSSAGEVRSVNRVVPGTRSGKATWIRVSGRTMKLRTGDDGYVRVRLNRDNTGRGFLVHRLVALAHVKNPDDKPQAAHKDGDRSNNKASNIVWATQSENEQHKRAHGTDRGGARHPLARLSQAQVAEVRASPRERLGELAKELGVTRAHVNSVRSGRRWPLYQQEERKGTHP